LDAFKERITVIPGATNDPEVIKRALAGCDGVLVVLVPRGVHGYSTGTAQAVLDHAHPNARLVFSCGWHITRDGQDVYSRKLKAIVKVFGPLARLARFADLDDQVEACRRVFASDTRWTVVRGSNLEEGESEGLPVWSRHVGDPILESNRTRHRRDRVHRRPAGRDLHLRRQHEHQLQRRRGTRSRYLRHASDRSLSGPRAPGLGSRKARARFRLTASRALERRPRRPDLCLVDMMRINVATDVRRMMSTLFRDSPIAEMANG